MRIREQRKSFKELFLNYFLILLRILADGSGERLVCHTIDAQRSSCTRGTLAEKG